MSYSNGIGETLCSLFALDGKVSVVTGAGAGIGKASALLLAKAGAVVVAADEDLPAANRVVEEIAGSDRRAKAIEVDVRREDSVVALFEQVKASFGKLDILVNAATVMVNMPLTETTAEQWDLAQSINLRGAFLCSREAVKMMLQSGKGGRIINITTIGAEHPVLHGNAAYSSSKAGLNMLTRNVAMDYAQHGILVNAVMPGAIPTEDTAKVTAQKKISGPGANPERHPSGHGTPQDVAPAVLFLAGPAARYITGQTFAVDGGFQVS